MKTSHFTPQFVESIPETLDPSMLYLSMTLASSSPPTTDDTTRLQAALNTCAGTGRSVVLIGTPTANAFYSTQITVNGEGLVIAPGVTLEGNDGYASQS
jgi:polygalacturonase